MKLGMTGTQTGMSDKQRDFLERFLKDNSFNEGHHGDCIGADAEFHQYCIAAAVPVVLHPPLRSYKRAFCREYVRKLPQKDYLRRNDEIVISTDLLIAFPKGSEEVRSGTWYTVRMARRLNRPILIVYPNGLIVKEGDAWHTVKYLEVVVNG